MEYNDQTFRTDAHQSYEFKKQNEYSTRKNSLKAIGPAF